MQYKKALLVLFFSLLFVSNFAFAGNYSAAMLVKSSDSKETLPTGIYLYNQKALQWQHLAKQPKSGALSQIVQIYSTPTANKLWVLLTNKQQQHGFMQFDAKQDKWLKVAALPNVLDTQIGLVTFQGQLYAYGYNHQSHLAYWTHYLESKQCFATPRIIREGRKIAFNLRFIRNIPLNAQEFLYAVADSNPKAGVANMFQFDGQQWVWQGQVEGIWQGAGQTGEGKIMTEHVLSKNLARFPAAYGGIWLAGTDDRDTNYMADQNADHQSWEIIYPGNYGFEEEGLHINGMCTDPTGNYLLISGSQDYKNNVAHIQTDTSHYQIFPSGPGELNPFQNMIELGNNRFVAVGLYKKALYKKRGSYAVWQNTMGVFSGAKQIVTADRVRFNYIFDMFAVGNNGWLVAAKDNNVYATKFFTTTELLFGLWGVAKPLGTASNLDGLSVNVVELK